MMMPQFKPSVALCLCVSSVAFAQQFKDFITQYELMGLSDACVQELNTTTACNAELPRNAPDFESGMVADIMPKQALDSICTPICRKSLQLLRPRVVSACGNETVKNLDQAYPPYYFVDRLLFAYDTSCYKDKSSGKYCDEVLAQWREDDSENTNYTANHDCEDCMLGPMRLMLENAISYDQDVEEDFKSITASCKAAGYDYTVPPVFASSQSPPVTTAKPTDPTWCETKYTVKIGDTCDLIAAANDVSTYGIVTGNGLLASCDDLPEQGSQICLPPKCKTTRISYGDSCKALAETFDVTAVQIAEWNPNLDFACMNIGLWYNTHICVGPPGGSQSGDPTTTVMPTVVPAPTNAASDSNKNCASWHTVVKDEYCAKIAQDNDLSLDDFYFLNPSVDTECRALLLGTAYCVRPVGDITTYTSYPSHPPPTSFTRPPTSTYTVPQTTQSPQAPGSQDKCTLYINYFDSSDLVSQYGGNDVLERANRCSTLAGKYHFSIEDFVKWNPSLDAKDCRLKPGFSYCVQVEKPSATSTA